MTKDVAILQREVNRAGGSEWVSAKQAEILGADLLCTDYRKEVFPEILSDVDVKQYGSRLDLPILEITANRYNYVFNTGIEFLKNYDVIIAHKPLAAVLAYKAKRKYGDIKVIWYCHHPDKGIYDIHSSSGLFSKLTSIPLKRLDQKMYKNIDKIFVNSENTRDNQLKKCYELRADIEVLYPPVKTYGKSKTVGDYAFCVSRVLPFKQFEIAVDALSELDRDIGLKIAGGIENEDYKREIEDLAAEKEVDIEFLGFVSESEIERHIKNCKFGVFTSQNEDFGLVPLEFLSAGKVCFVPESAGVSEIVPKKYHYNRNLATSIRQTGKFIDNSLIDKIESLNENHYSRLRKEVNKD